MSIGKKETNGEKPQKKAEDVDPQEIESFSDFYPYYLTEHSLPKTKLLHFIGTNFAFLILIRALRASDVFERLRMLALVRRAVSGN